MRFPAWIFLAGFASGFAIAQDPAQPPSPPKSCSPIYQSTHGPDTVMKGMPYSAKRVLTCEEPQADGTILKGSSTVLEWRDSMGRVRVEQEERYSGGPDLYSVQVTDPVERVMWQWYEGKGSSHQVIETKYQFKVYTQWPTNFRFGSFVKSEGPGWKDERLQPKWVNGVYATGDRYIQVFAPGQNGNRTDHPVTAAYETWLSVDLGLIVESLKINADGRKETEELRDIDRSEPDPRLFNPPAGYEVLDASIPITDPGMKTTVVKPKSPGKPALVIMSPAGNPPTPQK